MTLRELYEICEEKGLLDYEISVDDISYTARPEEVIVDVDSDERIRVRCFDDIQRFFL